MLFVNRQLLLPILFLCGLHASAGCGSAAANRERLAVQMTAVTKEAGDLLATVKDEATAKAAAPKLKAICNRMEKLTERLDEADPNTNFDSPSSKELEKYGQWMAEHSRLMQEELRVAQIPGATAALGEPWQRLTGGIFDPGGPMAPGGVMDPRAGQPAP